MTAAAATPDLDHERRRAYARLALVVGVGLRSGEDLLVEAEHAHAPFARAIAEEAYAAGARHVDVHYGDAFLRRAQAQHADERDLDHTPSWQAARIDEAAATGAPVVAISGGSNADTYAGIDAERLARTRRRAFERSWLEAVLGRRMPWTMLPGPTESWAREVLGEPDAAALWEAISCALRLDAGDPAAAWATRMEQLEERAHDLTERRFRSLRYRGPGTRLEVPLIAGARWLTAQGATIDGRTFVANLPSEEVFTSPHRTGATGVVRASLPLAMRGTTVEGLELELADGEIVDARARSGLEAVREELATDAGARRLGEVALVDHDSRVRRTGLVFRSALLDENAASHIAWGQGIPWALEDAGSGAAAGVLNASAVHTDFMVGSADLEVEGVDAAGVRVPLLLGGEWQLR